MLEQINCLTTNVLGFTKAMRVLGDEGLFLYLDGSETATMRRVWSLEEKGVMAGFGR